MTIGRIPPPLAGSATRGPHSADSRTQSNQSGEPGAERNGPPARRSPAGEAGSAAAARPARTHAAHGNQTAQSPDAANSDEHQPADFEGALLAASVLTVDAPAAETKAAPPPATADVPPAAEPGSPPAALIVEASPGADSGFATTPPASIAVRSSAEPSLPSADMPRSEMAPQSSLRAAVQPERPLPTIEIAQPTVEKGQSAGRDVEKSAAVASSAAIARSAPAQPEPSRPSRGRDESARAIGVEFSPVDRQVRPTTDGAAGVESAGETPPATGRSDPPTRTTGAVFTVEPAEGPAPVAAGGPRLDASLVLKQATPQPATRGAEPEGEPAVQAVSRGMSAALAQRGGVVHVKLMPPSLGEVRVRMDLHEAAVSVRIEATTATAHGLLSQSLAMLRASLESRGIAVDRLAVHLAPAGPAPAAPPVGGDAGPKDAPDPWAGGQRHDAGGSPSRGGGEQRGAHGGAPDESPEETNDSGGAPPARFGVFPARLRLRLNAVA